MKRTQDSELRENRRRRKQSWMTDGIIDIMVQRGKYKNKVRMNTRGYTVK